MEGTGVKVKVWLFAAVLLAVLSATVLAVPPGGQIIYEGKGAGQVVFDGTVHARKTTCPDCHESLGLTPALFDMKRGASWITMKKMERGRSCGYCHEILPNDSLSCSLCHRK